MTISEKDWKTKYIARLKKAENRAAGYIEGYLDFHEVKTLQDWNALIDFAYSVATTYGEGSAAIACEFYDAIAAASNVLVPAAVPADTATYQEVARAIRGTGKTENPELISGSIGRLVKLAGADTTLKNAMRDNAEFAWIPSGDTCALCLQIASYGWQKAGKKTLSDTHAKHIHANCDCTYAVRFDPDTTVAGYDPGKWDDLVDNADYSFLDGATRGESSSLLRTDDINIVRRELYKKNKDKINAQKRAAYAARQANDSGD